MSKLLKKTVYYLSEDDFPIKVEPYNEEIHKDKHRDREYPYENDVVITRYWKEPERWGLYGRFNSLTTKAEFDLWVEYWKRYWKHDELMKSGTDLEALQVEASAMENLKAQISEMRRKEREA